MAAVRARSEAQRAASRRNGAESRGPRTAAGKARSSRNALRHGLRGAVHLVVPGEDPSALDALRAAFSEDYAPRGILAACLADRLALTFWKLSRCDRLEVQLAGMPSRPQRGWLEAEPGMPAALSRLPEHAALERARARLDRFLVRGIALLEGGAAGRRRRRRRAVEDDDLAPASVMVGPRPDHPASSSASEPRTRAFVPPSSPASDPGTQPMPTGPSTGSADTEPTALLEATARRLLAEGRVGEATAVLRRLPRPPRAAARAAEADWDASPEAREAMLDADIDAVLAGLPPDVRALWDSVGYESWVVPPLPGRMCLASLTNEGVTPADRWRVLEEVRRLDDPAETARVLARFAEAGLDPGLDHPAFVGAVPPSSLAFSSSSSDPEEESDVDRLLRNNPVLRRVVEESDAYHEACRMRHEARRWKKHAEELGVPLPPTRSRRSRPRRGSTPRTRARPRRRSRPRPRPPASPGPSCPAGTAGRAIPGPVRSSRYPKNVKKDQTIPSPPRPPRPRPLLRRPRPPTRGPSPPGWPAHRPAMTRRRSHPRPPSRGPRPSFPRRPRPPTRGPRPLRAPPPARAPHHRSPTRPTGPSRPTTSRPGSATPAPRGPRARHPRARPPHPPRHPNHHPGPPPAWAPSQPGGIETTRCWRRPEPARRAPMGEGPAV